MVHYLASPYTNHDKSVEEENYKKSQTATFLFSERSVWVYSPIALWHPIAMTHKCPTNFEFYQKQNHSFIDAFESVYVLVTPYTRDSRGVADEIAYAKDKDYPIKYWALEPSGLVLLSGRL